MKKVLPLLALALLTSGCALSVGVPPPCYGYCGGGWHRHNGGYGGGGPWIPPPTGFGRRWQQFQGNWFVDDNGYLRMFEGGETPHGKPLEGETFESLTGIPTS